MKRIHPGSLSRPLAVAVLAVSIGAVAGPVAWRLSGERVGGATLVAGEPAGRLSSEDERPDISGVLAANPFGSAMPPEAPAGPVGESDLGFTLMGVTLGNPQENSRAMISDSDANSKSYAVGAELAIGVAIAEIKGDHVVLSVNGTLQTLSFPNAIALATSAAPAAPVADAFATSGVAALNRLVPAEVSYFVADPVEATDPDSVIARYRDAIRQNPTSVMLRLGIEATDRGYLVKKDTSQGVLNAGFRPGDVIRTVNGKAVGNLQSDAELFDEVALAGLAQVELVRDGEEIKLSFPLR
jgi:general secretion pathway protein C